jgi:hypothetical protein
VRADVRRIWTLAEPLHALTYFAPEAQTAFEAAGLRGFWRGYFAGRAAPLGVTPAEVVTATFHGFHPDFVARAIPSIWQLITPVRAVDARLAGIDRAVRDHFADPVASVAARRAAEQIRTAVDGASLSGRPLFAANAALGWPDQPHLALWHAVTLLREHRGDGHIGVLTAAGIDGCEAHTLRIADDGLPLDSIRPFRGWSGEDWTAAAARLRARGWLDDDGRSTAEGARVRAGIEADTDRLSRDLLDRIADVDVVVDALAPIADRLAASDTIPYPNPIGVPRHRP